MGKLAITFPSMVLLALGFPGACGPSCAGSGGGGDGGVSDTSAAGGDWKRAHDAFLAALDAGVPDIDVEGMGAPISSARSAERKS